MGSQSPVGELDRIIASSFLCLQWSHLQGIRIQYMQIEKKRAPQLED